VPACAQGFLVSRCGAVFAGSQQRTHRFRQLILKDLSEMRSDKLCLLNSVVLASDGKVVHRGFVALPGVVRSNRSEYQWSVRYAAPYAQHRFIRFMCMRYMNHRGS